MININQVYHSDAVWFFEKNRIQNAFDLILFSPPYDNIRTYDHNQGVDLFALGRVCKTALKDGGILAMVIQDQTKNFAKSLTSFRTTVQYVDQLGFRLWECIIYNRPGKPGAWWSRRFRVDHEYIMIFLKGKRPNHFDKSQLLIPAKHAGTVWSGTQRHTNGDLTPIKKTEQNALKCPGTVWQMPSSNSEGNKKKMEHPATFPDELARRLILAFTQEGAIVCDPMCGSGTTLCMAKNNGRNFVGVDVSSKYCNLSREMLGLPLVDRDNDYA